MFGRIVRIEGGYVDHKNDRGGATKYGISLRFLAVEGKLDLNKDGYEDFDLNRDGSIDSRDVRLLTPAQAEALYLRVFWIRTGFWSLPMPFDLALFDMGVNAGTVTAGKLMQRALNTFGPPPLTPDGDVGPMTRRRLDIHRKDKPVLAAFRDQAASHYRAIVKNDPDQAVFLKGWLNRAKELGRA